MVKQGPIGIFDSGYGGLTILKEIINKLPKYDYLYLGDNARTPYGNRSFETVYKYTLECVNELFNRGCHLVILACNTASAKALRSIQQNDLPIIDPKKRVLGVIRPTAETIGTFSKNKKIGILATQGTIASQSYPIEIQKFFPDINVYQEACPLWVPLVENNEYNKPGADYFIKQHINNLLSQSGNIDCIVLGCTHYPLLEDKIKSYLPKHIQLLSQGKLVAESLATYLENHPEIEAMCKKTKNYHFLTTDSSETFNLQATHFFGNKVNSEHITLKS
jgi:glutamate racemase